MHYLNDECFLMHRVFSEVEEGSLGDQPFNSAGILCNKQRDHGNHDHDQQWICMLVKLCFWIYAASPLERDWCIILKVYNWIPLNDQTAFP